MLLQELYDLSLIGLQESLVRICTVHPSGWPYSKIAVLEINGQIIRLTSMCNEHYGKPHIIQIHYNTCNRQDLVPHSHHAVFNSSFHITSNYPFSPTLVFLMLRAYRQYIDHLYGVILFDLFCNTHKLRYNVLDFNIVFSYNMVWQWTTKCIEKLCIICTFFVFIQHSCLTNTDSALDFSSSIT